MRSRGEQDFLRFPRIAARLYDYLMAAKPMRRQYLEIARDLVTHIDRGRLLNVGTGPGQVLLELHQLNPALELFGLDISAAMVALARSKLSNIPVEICQGTIEATRFPNDHFDLVTSCGSFYLWDHPVDCLGEIHRILKPGYKACLYETHRDDEEATLRPMIRRNLISENLLRRTFGPICLRQQLRMTYTEDEIRQIVEASPFARRYNLVRMEIGGLPIWLRIELRKCA